MIDLPGLSHSLLQGAVCFFAPGNLGDDRVCRATGDAAQAGLPSAARARAEHANAAVFLAAWLARGAQAEPTHCIRIRARVSEKAGRPVAGQGLETGGHAGAIRGYE